jgi:hypothetical protein
MSLFDRPKSNQKGAGTYGFRTSLLFILGFIGSSPSMAFWLAIKHRLSKSTAVFHPRKEASPSSSLTPGCRRLIGFIMGWLSLLSNIISMTTVPTRRMAQRHIRNTMFLWSTRKDCPEAVSNGGWRLIIFLAPARMPETWRVKGGLRARAWGLGISR